MFRRKIFSIDCRPLSLLVNMNGSAELLPAQRLFESGWNSLSDLELLALVLAPTDSDQQALTRARRIIELLGSIRRLRRASYSLLRQAGMTRRQTYALLAAAHLFQRLGNVPLAAGDSLHNSSQVYRHFRGSVPGLLKECFWTLLLDGKNRTLKLVKVSEGTLTSSLVHPREVFRPAIEEAAAGVILAHNHPSGDPTPSREDREITRRLVATGEVVGIRVLDHVIIGPHRYFSFADEGLL